MKPASLPKTYDFKSTEQRIYDWWHDCGYFQSSNPPDDPDFDPNLQPYVISIPPPNVTGELHLGHAMFVSTEDMMIRYHRMLGHPTLWVPGSDHAGIATQLQVEKDLESEGVTREDIGRTAFIERAWQWKDKYGGIITQQMRRLGASCDWSRERFTLDEGLSKAVIEAFVRLYEENLIYRGPRIINWSPGLMTAVSDLEVDYVEEQGQLYYFKYRLLDSSEYIPVATTRPETILADTAVAVHPDDQRFSRFVNRTALVPIIDREIPVIADQHVDPAFGTGALKITPGHDPNDYKIGQRHNLPIITILDKEAHLTDQAGPYKGMDRFQARRAIWADIESAKLAIKQEPHMLNVPRSQRGGEIVEPMVSTQWFVKTKPLAKSAIDAVRKTRIRIIPERFQKVYFNWLENIDDWCISRQLWWGHRIPIWYAPDGTIFCARSESDAYEKARAQFGAQVKLVQDPDVLDTWFSSGLWPFSTLGWPDKTPDLRYFYPTSMLETGYDILFFWVARMIMMGMHLTGNIPFREVYLHGLVRDEYGRKMSKTLGNVINPLKLMDEFGADALRFTLLTGSTPGNDMNLSIDRVKSNRNFANKIWNASRYVIGQLHSIPSDIPAGKPTLPDRWILARLHLTIANCTRLIENHQYGQAGSTAYDFIWNDYADWYIEIAKQQLLQPQSARTTGATLVTVLDSALRLLHPYVPFVTEEIWQRLKQSSDTSFSPEDGWPEALIIAPWPTANIKYSGATDDLQDFTHIMDIVRSIRNARAEHKVDPARIIASTIVAPDYAAILTEYRSAIAALSHLSSDTFRVSATRPSITSGAISTIVGTTEIYLSVQDLRDPAEEIKRVNKEIEEHHEQIKRLQTLLASQFTDKAPPHIVRTEHDRLAEHERSVEKLKERLSDIDN